MVSEIAFHCLAIQLSRFYVVFVAFGMLPYSVGPVLVATVQRDTARQQS